MTIGILNKSELQCWSSFKLKSGLKVVIN
jgi:hypothetical protein